MYIAMLYDKKHLFTWWYILGRRVSLRWYKYNQTMIALFSVLPRWENVFLYRKYILSHTLSDSEEERHFLCSFFGITPNNPASSPGQTPQKKSRLFSLTRERCERSEQVLLGWGALATWRSRKHEKTFSIFISQISPCNKTWYIQGLERLTGYNLSLNLVYDLQKPV